VTAADAGPAAKAPVAGASEFDVNFELSRGPKHRVVLLNPVDEFQANINLPFYARDLETQ
jgi:hypothetical protein